MIARRIGTLIALLSLGVVAARAQDTSVIKHPMLVRYNARTDARRRATVHQRVSAATKTKHPTVMTTRTEDLAIRWRGVVIR